LSKVINIRHLVWCDQRCCEVSWLEIDRGW